LNVSQSLPGDYHLQSINLHALTAIAAKIGCSAEALRNWVRQMEREQGHRPGLTTSERERLKELERENRELRGANEILRKASACFAHAELDRRPKVMDARALFGESVASTSQPRLGVGHPSRPGTESPPDSSLA